MVKNKGKGPAQPPQQKKARPSAPSSSQCAKPREGKGSRPASPPATAPNPPPLSASFADAAAGTSQQQQQQPSRVSSPIIDVEMAGSRSASPPGTAAPANTTTTSTTTQTPAGQSGAGQKASSGPKGTKRRLALPDWTVGEPLFRVKEWEAYQRPPPKVSHQFVAYVSLKDLSLKARDIIIAGANFFGRDLVAAEVFAASWQIAFAFPTAQLADAAAKHGLPYDETILPLERRADYQPRLRRLTVSNVDCTSPKAAVQALQKYFATYGRVLDVTPRYWADTHVHNGVWHVTLDCKQCKVNQPPRRST